MTLSRWSGNKRTHLSQLRRYPRLMIDPGALACLHEHRHEVHAYCLRCDRWRVLPLAVPRCDSSKRGLLSLELWHEGTDTHVPQD